MQTEPKGALGVSNINAKFTKRIIHYYKTKIRSITSPRASQANLIREQGRRRREKQAESDIP
jgi:hypothetical protein